MMKCGHVQIVEENLKEQNRATIKLHFRELRIPTECCSVIGNLTKFPIT